MPNDNEKIPNGSTDSPGLFTEKDVVGDVDFIDIDAARRQRARNGSVPPPPPAFRKNAPENTGSVKKRPFDKKLKIPAKKPPVPKNRPTEESQKTVPSVRPVSPARQGPPAPRQTDPSSPAQKPAIRNNVPEPEKTGRGDVSFRDETKNGPSLSQRIRRPFAQNKAENPAALSDRSRPAERREERTEAHPSNVPARRIVTKDDEEFKKAYADSVFPVRRFPAVPERNDVSFKRPSPSHNAGVDAAMVPDRAPENIRGDRETQIRRDPSENADINARRAPVPAPVTRTPAVEEEGEERPSFSDRVKSFFKRGEKKEKKVPESRKSAARLQMEEFDADGSNKEENNAKMKSTGAVAATAAVKTIVYIAIVGIVSVLIALFAINVGNDVFAFKKEAKQVEITIKENATLDEIAKALADKDVIKYPKIFSLYMKIKKKDVGEYLSGTFTVSTDQSYDALFSVFRKKTETFAHTEISVTIPEGYTVDDIIDLFVSKGVGTREGFVDAIQNHEYDYWFVEELKELNPDRKYRLEGYLYPDTYYVYQEWEEWRIIDKLLKNFYNKFSIEYKKQCEALGMSVDDVVNLASIIQMEAKYTPDFSIVSAVIHNRLDNAMLFGRRLECDSTIQYILPQRKENIDANDLAIDNKYNSYLYAGLPPGPISNPTIVAINAALYPSVDDGGYYYFVSQKDGHMLYAKDYATHQANIAKARAE